MQRMFRKCSFGGSHWVWGLGALRPAGRPAHGASTRGLPQVAEFSGLGWEGLTVLALCPYPAGRSLLSHLGETPQSFLAGGLCATNRPRVPAWEPGAARLRVPCTWAWREGHAAGYTARLRGREKEPCSLPGTVQAHAGGRKLLALQLAMAPRGQAGRQPWQGLQPQGRVRAPSASPPRAWNLVGGGEAHSGEQTTARGGGTPTTGGVFSKVAPLPGSPPCWTPGLLGTSGGWGGTKPSPQTLRLGFRMEPQRPPGTSPSERRPGSPRPSGRSPVTSLPGRSHLAGGLSCRQPQLFWAAALWRVLAARSLLKAPPRCVWGRRQLLLGAGLGLAQGASQGPEGGDDCWEEGRKEPEELNKEEGHVSSSFLNVF